MNNTTTWSFDRSDIFVTIGFSYEECNILQDKADDFIRAILNVSPSSVIELQERNKNSASSSAPLYIPGKRYHINLSESAKNTLISTVGLIADAYILHNLKLLDSSIYFSTIGIQNLITQTTKLTDRQRSILDTIYKLKRKKRSPLYCPTTKQIADQLGLTQGEIKDALIPIQGKVVQYEADKKTWNITL